jgi:hypothetical protein
MYETCSLRGDGDSYFGLLCVTQCNLISRYSHFTEICCPHYETYALKMDAGCVLWNLCPRLPEYMSLGWSKYQLSVRKTTVTELVNVAANTLDFHSRGSRLESWPEDRQIWDLFRFSSARPGKYLNYTSIMLWLFPSKSYFVHHLLTPYYSTVYSQAAESVIKESTNKLRAKMPPYIKHAGRWGEGARGSVVGWDTMQQPGRPRIRFLMSLKCFQLTRSSQPQYDAAVDWASNRNQYQESSWG